MEYASTTIARGFAFPEGPRWHHGEFVFSDQHDGDVITLGAEGKELDRLRVPGGPSGTGWLPNGDLLVASMEEHKLFRHSGGKLTVHADLSKVHHFHTNDMVVDAKGNAYVGNIGFNPYSGEERRTTVIALVRPDGSVSVAADGLEIPNGTVITPDGKRLIVAESYGERLTQFDINADGTLSNRRLFAALPGHLPDGICIDAESAIWVASCASHAAIRVKEGGEITDTVPLAGESNTYACMLGGTDRRNLYLCVADSFDPTRTRDLRSGRIDVARVTVPGAGWP